MGAACRPATAKELYQRHCYRWPRAKDLLGDAEAFMQEYDEQEVIDRWVRGAIRGGWVRE